MWYIIFRGAQTHSAVEIFDLKYSNYYTKYLPG